MSRVPLLLLALLPACAETRTSISLESSEPATHAPATKSDFGYELESYSLPNGLAVTLHRDTSLPKVVINTWFAVGSRDEAPGRTGFAHLFEHLMFMGTGRVPDDQFDVLMERGGGSNNASTSNDRTNYYSIGPSSLLPTLLWLDADRLDALDDFMTQEKLDRQRDVVRNERRQTTENTPYGKAFVLLPEALYPEGHPYHHPVIGSHEDLEAATLEDVVGFFRTYYVPGNASLVVAGDFEPAEVKDVIAHTFGAIPVGPTPIRADAPPAALEHEKFVVATDKVQFPRLYLAWHSPGYYMPGDAELDLLSTILSDGPSSRLERRLVLETGLAQSVSAFQWSRDLGSSYVIDALASEGTDLEGLKREILAVLEELIEEGPTAEELARAQAQHEARFLNGMENLGWRADQMNEYRAHFGTADGFARDLARFNEATVAGLRRVAGEVFGPGRVDLRILPEEAALAEANLDERPADFPRGSFEPPPVQSFVLSNGVAVHALPRPGTKLVAGSLLVRGGASLVPDAKAGLARLLASVMDSGAGGKSAADFAAAVESLGCNLGTGAGEELLTVSFSGLTSRLEPSLDLFRDLVRAPNLAAEDFEREKRLQLAAIAARADDPNQVASDLFQLLVFGAEDPRGRPLSGRQETVEGLELADVREAAERLVSPDRAVLVMAGDFDLQGLRAELEARFGDWRPRAEVEHAPLTPVTRPQPGRIVLFDRPGAPQTVIRIGRPVTGAEGLERAVRNAVATVFGGTFTSRLNANLRERNGYTYGASARVQREGRQELFVATSAVRTDVTGASLAEFKSEFDRMAAEGITDDELAKAVETLRRRVVETVETTGRVASSIAGLVSDGRPLDSAARDLAALDDVTLEAANAQATGGLYAWNDLLVVLVGDAEAVRPQLAELGFPAPVLVNADGMVIE